MTERKWEPLPLPKNPTFDDLLFRRHGDFIVGHLHALHTLEDGQLVSITIGGRNDGTQEAPYEMMTPDGETHAPLTENGVTALLAKCINGEIGKHE